MGSRRVEELPVRILTDEELLGEYGRTFNAVGAAAAGADPRGRDDERAIRRNSAVFGELVRRGYRSKPPVWTKVRSSTVA